MRYLLIVLNLFLLFSCSKKEKIPKDIIQREEMESVLWDLLRGGEFLETYVLSRDTTNLKAAKAQDLYENVFRIHKTDRAVFEKSYTWYQQHPELMKDILDSLNKKPTPSFHPPGQALNDTSRKRDTGTRTPLVFPGGHPTFNVDSMRKAHMKAK